MNTYAKEQTRERERNHCEAVGRVNINALPMSSLPDSGDKEATKSAFASRQCKVERRADEHGSQQDCGPLIAI
jgi:hypothetical protein